MSKAQAYKKPVTDDGATEQLGPMQSFAKSGQGIISAKLLREHYGVLYKITQGDTKNIVDRAQQVMNSIEYIAAKNRDDAVHILSDGQAVYQLARHGQAERVFKILKKCKVDEQVKILSADEALFGLVDSFSNKAKDSAFKFFYRNLSESARFKIENQPKKGNAQMRNAWIVEHYNLVEESLALAEARANEEGYYAEP